MWKKGLLLLLSLYSVTLIHCQFDCHDDPSYEPAEGTLLDLQFTWLGVLQYIHVKKGSPHYFRVPRVVLINRQFALSTAVDAAQVPDGYALGNIVFGEYERDETECRVSIEEIATGAECEPAVLLMPIADVLLHPEYKHFGAKYSFALLKLITHIKSKYMLPVCLPLTNYVTRTDRTQMTKKLFHVDFSSEVPRDFVDEEKEVTWLGLLPKDVCRFYHNKENSTNIDFNRVMCSNGCGFHSGAPTIVHEHTGHFSVVAMAQGFIMPRVSTHNLLDQGWVGHWWMGGIRCYDRGQAADDLFRFYHEIFQITPRVDTNISYYIQIDAAHDTLIACVKVGMPYQLGTPRIWDLGTSSIKLRIPIIKISRRYKIQVEAWAHNNTKSDEVSDDVSDDDVKDDDVKDDDVKDDEANDDNVKDNDVKDDDVNDDNVKDDDFNDDNVNDRN